MLEAQICSVSIDLRRLFKVAHWIEFTAISKFNSGCYSLVYNDIYTDNRMCSY